jgi:hypothetical protein
MKKKSNNAFLYKSLQLRETEYLVGRSFFVGSRHEERESLKKPWYNKAQAIHF